MGLLIALAYHKPTSFDFFLLSFLSLFLLLDGLAELERAAAVVSSGVAATPVVAFLDATDIVAVGATAAQLAAGLIAVGTGGRAAAAAAVAAPAVVAARSPEYEPSVGKTWA